tara:strand:- start:394 stop:936 length:543 start_codon:yes stop_codon:yes gene_type:complete
MHKTFSLLLVLLISTNNLFGEDEEQSKKLLFAQTIDNQNEKLGKSIDPEIRLKLIKYHNELNIKNTMLFSGFEYLENKIEGDLVKFIYRAHADTSYYPDEQIKEVKDFLIKDRIVLCKYKNYRKYLFLLNPQYEFSVIDKLNKPFINFSINKESCREVEPFGRDKALTEWDIKRLISKMN